MHSVNQKVVAGVEGTSSDILFQNSASGQTAIWDVNGTTIAGGAPVSADAGPSWRRSGSVSDAGFVPQPLSPKHARAFSLPRMKRAALPMR